MFLAVRNEQIEAAYAMGATRCRYYDASSFQLALGTPGASTLSMGRALGETMAVTMVIGNTDPLRPFLFGTTQTMLLTVMNDSPGDRTVRPAIADGDRGHPSPHCDPASTLTLLVRSSAAAAIGPGAT